jgi:carbamoyltransferase
MAVRILGISAYYHDSAAALIVDGRIVAAAQEERFTRKKHDANFPRHAILACLQQAKIHPREIDFVTFYDKPFSKFERLLETYLAFAPRGFSSFRHALPLWLKEKLFQKSLLIRELTEVDTTVEWGKKLLFPNITSATRPAPFTRHPFSGQLS